MRNILIIIILALVWACRKPYENVNGDTVYDGKPVVMLSSESANIKIGTVFVDSLELSSTITQDLKVTLEFVGKSSFGKLGDNFVFEETVVIKAGKYYGNFNVEAVEIPDVNTSLYKLAIRIKDVDNPNVISGLYGIQIEGEDREKRIKVYSFQK